MTYYRIETAGGELITDLHDLDADEARLDAETRLAEDPELGQLEVLRVVEECEHIWTITSAPTNTLGDSAIIALRPGEAIPNPGYSVRVPPRLSDEEFEELTAINGPYADDPGKRIGMQQMREGGWC